MASTALPRTIDEALDWSEFIYNTNGVYRSALKRIAAYCITDIEVVPAKAATANLDKEKRERYVKLFTSNSLDAKRLGVEFAVALLVYGNVFVSMHTRFTRYLECPKCHAIVSYTIAMENSSLNLVVEDNKFKCTCPSCRERGGFTPSDEYSEKPEDLYVRFWNPHEIEIKYDRFTGDSTVVWKIPNEYKQQIKSGDLEAIATCPLDVLKVIQEDSDLRFNKRVILHSKEGALPGIKADGWGIPSIIPNFRAAWYWQLIHKYNEVFATDFIMPTRCLSPAPQGDIPTDPLFGSGMDKFIVDMERMIHAHEKKPTAWMISPYPVQYQTLGGDAAKFLPREQLEHGKATLLSSIGIPVEMYDGTMQLQSAPCALRLFESNWSWVISALQRFLQFMADRAAFYLNEDPVALRYKRISHADDMSRQQSLLQLGGSGALSQTTMLGSLGIDKQEEMRLQLEEDRANAELQEEQQSDLQTMQMFKEMVPNGVQTGLQNYQATQQQQMGPPPGGGAAPPAGMPPAGGGGMPIGGGMPPAGMTMGGGDPIDQMIANAGTLPTDTPDDLVAKAQTLCQQVLQAGPQRPAFLRKLKSKDPQIHALVKSLVEQNDNQAKMQGLQQARGF